MQVNTIRTVFLPKLFILLNKSSGGDEKRVCVFFQIVIQTNLHFVSRKIA